jgi:hypothetical protein
MARTAARPIHIRRCAATTAIMKTSTCAQDENGGLFEHLDPALNCSRHDPANRVRGARERLLLSGEKGVKGGE